MKKKLTQHLDLHLSQKKSTEYTSIFFFIDSKGMKAEQRLKKVETIKNFYHIIIAFSS